jgi:hypothetical protein
LFRNSETPFSYLSGACSDLSTNTYTEASTIADEELDTRYEAIQDKNMSSVGLSAPKALTSQEPVRRSERLRLKLQAKAFILPP